MDNRTGLSPADIAELFRDMCGDGSVEWVHPPTQTWVLLDAADMLDENVKLRELVSDMWRWTHRPCSDCEHWQRITSNVGTCSAGHCVLRSSIESRLREFGLEDA